MLKEQLIKTLISLILLSLTVFWPALAAKELDKKSFIAFKDPIREQSVIITPEGYYPKTINIFKGEKLRIFLTTTEGQSCLIIPSFDIFMAGRAGTVTTKEVVFQKEGKYPFHCPTGQIKGEIIVWQHPLERTKSSVSRKIASTREKKEQWRPQPRIDW